METIIVQEKDEAILEILTIALQSKGFRVCGLRTCDESLMKLIELRRPYVVILDYEFEDRTCIQTRQRIKVHHSHLPVIVMSCNNNIKEEYSKHGFEDCIPKPFDLDQLYSVVGKHLSKREKSGGNSELAY